MKRLFIALALAQAGTLALAQSSPAASASGTGSGAAAAAAAFRCGGVGQADQDRMKAEAARHDLMVTFATSTGAYLADVDFEISSGGKVVLQGRCDGPLMLVDVPGGGSYEVRARAEGKEQRKTVRLGDRPANVTFVWPAG